MSSKFLFVYIFVVLGFCVKLTASPIGVVESWQIVSGIQDTYIGINQVYATVDTVQSPLQTYQQINYRQSHSGAFINATINDQDLVLIVEPEQHCERTNTSLPSCLSLGEIFLAPSVDVNFDFHGFYDYYLGGSPTAVSAYMKVTQMTANGSVGPVVTSQFFSASSLDGPMDGTFVFDSTVTLYAGTRYWVKYRLLSHASYDNLLPGSFVNGNGMLTIETHPVPEPPGMVALLIGLFLLYRRGRYVSCCL